MMKASMKTAISEFSAMRMVDEYSEGFYRPAGARFRELLSSESGRAAELARQRMRLTALWNETALLPPTSNDKGPFRVGETFDVSVEAFLGDLLPEEIEVELYYGVPKSADVLTAAQAVPMTVSADLGSGRYLYKAELSCSRAGRYGFTARMSPRGDGWVKNTPGFLTWAQKS